MLRFGSVIVFKPEVSLDEAFKALEKIKDVIDLSDRVNPTIEDLVEEFEDEHGSPIWYIP